VLFGIFSCLLVYGTAQNTNNGGGVKFEVGGKNDDSNIKTLFTTMNRTPDDSESGDGSGSDDTEIYSGSGSGEPIEEEKKTGEVITSKPTTTEPTKDTKTESKSTVMVINEVDDSKKTTEVQPTSTEGNDIVVMGPESTDDPSNTVGASTGDKQEEAGVNFTVGIIVGVVVGAILAILVIVFLVYRLRKKDEGSYSLDEPSSQAFIRDEKNGGGQGKEYFA